MLRWSSGVHRSMALRRGRRHGTVRPIARGARRGGPSPPAGRVEWDDIEGSERFARRFVVRLPDGAANPIAAGGEPDRGGAANPIAAERRARSRRSGEPDRGGRPRPQNVPLGGGSGRQRRTCRPIAVRCSAPTAGEQYTRTELRLCAETCSDAASGCARAEHLTGVAASRGVRRTAVRLDGPGGGVRGCGFCRPACGRAWRLRTLRLDRQAHAVSLPGAPTPRGTRTAPAAGVTLNGTPPHRRCAVGFCTIEGDTLCPDSPSPSSTSSAASACWSAIRPSPSSVASPWPSRSGGAGAFEIVT
jgi:hypothetical protein